MAIGLSAVADGMYVCVAENYPHRNKSGISSITVNIQAITCQWQIKHKTCIYVHLHNFICVVLGTS